MLTIKTTRLEGSFRRYMHVLTDGAAIIESAYTDSRVPPKKLRDRVIQRDESDVNQM